MLNISNHPDSATPRLDVRRFRAMDTLGDMRSARQFARVLAVLLVLLFLALFLPWTQNIRTRGGLTGRDPAMRPQTIHAIIPGRIEKWYVQEGQKVMRGDTIMRISEVKQEFFDPLLLERTGQQINAKEMTARSYQEKVNALDAQVDALNQAMVIKLDQARNKIIQANLQISSDSIRVMAAKTELGVARDQSRRGEEQFAQGLISMVELERRRVNVQRSTATMIDSENDLLDARNDLLNVQLEVGGIRNDYRDKLAKAESEKFSSMSQMYTTEAEVSKMQVDLASYVVRAGNYFITAPQNGYIIRAMRSGLGELIKEGEPLISILPERHEMAVEMYVLPMDMPLINKGQKVRFLFDGWPAIVFSGWPNVSYGTYGGEVVAIDNFISNNGKYRILVASDPDDKPWPDALRMGSGAVGIGLLGDVPIWYEMWRQLNGFPPDLYMDMKTVGNWGIDPEEDADYHK